MAQHDFPYTMLKESLRESLEAAKFCVNYKKNDPKWAPNISDKACLGYPGAILLFSIIDSIGSYFRKNDKFIVEVDGRKTTIKADGWEHFLILNSKYFEMQNLSQKYLKDIYNSLRSRLTHNSITGKNALMIPSNNILHSLPPRPLAFFKGQTDRGEDAVCISLFELYQLCERAVALFMSDIDNIVPISKVGKNFT